MDSTEFVRRDLVNLINEKVKSSDDTTERERLEKEHGQVWDTQELQEEYKVNAFLAPFVEVTRLSDGQRGLLTFQHMPRFYFNFTF